MQPTLDWRARAAAAVLLAPDQLDRAESALSLLPTDQQLRARDLVQAVAEHPPGLEGFKAALAALRAGLPTIAPEPFRGDPPAVAAVKLASLSALQGLAVLSGRALTADGDALERARALLAAIDAADAFRPGQRSVLRSEARQGLGDDLYVRALQG